MLLKSSVINKITAKGNDNIEYCEETILSESSQSRVTFVPFFIKHSDPKKERDLSIKLIKYNKNNKKISSQLIQENDFSLNKEAAINLRDRLNELFALKSVPESGHFLVIKMGEGETVDLSGLDSGDVARAVISILENEEVAANIDAVDFSDDLAFAFRHSIRIKGLVRAMDELEKALNENDNEQFYQDWCEANSWIFGNQYIMKDRERSISRNDKVDFLTASVISGFRDIVELKKPSFNVLNYDSSHSSYYFSSEVSKAIGQCHRYLDVFAEEAGRGLLDNPEIIAYHPRATIVIGRSKDWDDVKHRALHGLNSRLNNISILTYDHLLVQGRRLIDILKNGQYSTISNYTDNFDGDELPF